MKKSIFLISSLALLLAGCSEEISSVTSTPPTSSTSTVESSDSSVEVDSSTVELNPTVTITDAPETLYPGETYKVSFEVTDVEDEVTFSSSDEEVFIINEDGLVTAVGEGSATLTVDAGGVNDEVTISVSETLPNARTVLTNVVETRNYTINVTKDDEAYETLLYTPYAVNLSYVDSDEVTRYAVSEVDGIAFEYDVDEFGIDPGEQVADLSGFITAETLHGNPDNPYYTPIVGLGAISIENIDEEGEDNVYTLSLWNDASDRDTYNRYLFAFIADYQLYNFVTAIPRITSVTITVTGYYSFEVEVVCRLSTESTTHTYVLSIDDLTTTEIDDGIQQFITTDTGYTRELPSELLGSFEQLTTYNNYIITDTYSYKYYVTEDYCLFMIDDDYISTIQTWYGDYYSTDYTGYIKQDDGIYELYQEVSYDDTTSTITKGELTIGDKVEGTDADSTIAETIGYFSTWEALQDPYVYVDSTKFMNATTLGYVNGDPDTAQDSLEKAQSLLPLWAFETWGASEGQTYSGYRTHVISSGYDENPADSQVGVIIGYQVAETQKGLSSGYNYSTVYVTSFGEASLEEVEALL